MADIDNRLDQAVRAGKLCTDGVKDIMASMPYQEHLQIIRGLAQRNPSLDVQIAPGSTASNYSFEMKVPGPAPSSPATDSISSKQMSEMAKIMGMTPEQLRSQMGNMERGANSGATNYYREQGVTSSAFSGVKSTCSDVKKL